MTQEEKQLVLKDVCARLPYNCRIFVEFTDDLSHEINGYSNSLNTHYIYEFENDKVIIKPYLRPLSSMTEEEHKEYEQWLPDGYCIDTFDWLNAHNFDYRGLIPMGLAIDCTKLDIDIYDSSIRI